MRNIEQLLPDIQEARKLEKLSPQEAAEQINSLERPDIADIIRHIDPTIFTEFIPYIKKGKLKEIISKLDTNDLVEIFLKLDDEESEWMLQQMPPSQVTELKQQLQYPEDTAGSMMDRKVLTFSKFATIEEVIDKIRRAPKELLTYVYIVNEKRQLEGIVTQRALLLSDPKIQLKDIMGTVVVKVNVMTDREELSGLMQEHEYVALPVVDNNGRFLGVVRYDDVLKAVEEEASEDIQRLFGAGSEEKSTSPLRYSLSQRLPWLIVNLFTAFLAAAVVALFEPILAQYAVLAVLLPIVAGQSGNTGTQSLAVTIRALAMKEIEGIPVKYIMKNFILGLASGIPIAVITFLVVYFWKQDTRISIVISIAMIINVTVATVAGVLIPLFLKMIRQDPAQGSSILLTTITDCLGFASFLGFAWIFFAR